MDDATKSDNAMQLADSLIAKTPTIAPSESVISNNVRTKESKMADTTTRNIFHTSPSTGADGFLGGGGMGGGIGGFLLGALLARGTGLLGGNGGEAAVSQQMLSQDLGDIKAGVATSALETQKAVAASNMDVNATLFNQSGLIQSQMAAGALNTANNFAHTNQYLASEVNSIKDASDAGFMNIKDAVTSGVITGLQSDAAILTTVNKVGADGIAATLAASNASALQNAALQGLVDRNAFVLAEKIGNDGDKTRALINRINEDTLNRQLATAQAEIIELRGDSRLSSRTRDVEVNVTQNMNNAIAQSQSQAQLQAILGTVNALAGEVQRNSQSIVNLGTMSGSSGSQAAANTRVL